MSCYIIPACMRAKSLQSCPTLCDPLDCSLPSSPVHVVLQARILEWVAMPSSRGSSPHLFGRFCIFWADSALAGGFFTTSTIWVALYHY